MKLSCRSALSLPYRTIQSTLVFALSDAAAVLSPLQDMMIYALRVAGERWPAANVAGCPVSVFCLYPLPDLE